MRTIVLYLTVLGCALAVPNGYYHQEYNYKTSASAYKNNELQHQTDDQGYYRKDGDLEGRVKPRVDANSEHSEYVNPNLRNGEYNTGLIGGANGDMSSYGHMRADLGAQRSRDLSEGLAHSDHISGKRGAYSDYSSGSSYGANSYGANSYGTSHSYGTSSNLRSVTSRLQQELERDLQEAVQENRAYSQSSQLGVSELERELRQNLTNRLNAEIANKYGQQSIRGGLSYTIAGGRVQSTANYDNQELQDLRRQMESSLLNQLRTQYNSQGYNSHYESQNSHQSVYGVASTTVRPVYYTHYATPTYRPVTSIRPNYPADYNSQPTYVRYTPVSNPESITTIASRIQGQVDSRLNELLEDVERRYFSSGSSYSLTNVDVVLERLRSELRNNVTFMLNEEIRRNYGEQIPKDGHMYTVGSNGQTSGQHNYAIRDLENLRSQIERNLIEKLNRDFETHRTRWSQQSYRQSSSSGGHVQYGDYSTPRYDAYSTPRYDVYSTPRYDVYSTPRYVHSTPHYNLYDTDVEHLSTRPSANHLATLISNGGGTKNRQYNLAAGSSQSGYEVSGASSSASMSQLQRQLQHDLSRQLQSAINRGHYGSYSTSGSYNPQSYQVSLQQLSDELNRNLTRQLQEFSASSSYSTYGNIDQSQLASLRSQLQADLMRQLQQGLQQSYSSSSSYSASSSSSNGNYRPVRGFDNHQQGQYRSGGSLATMQGEDCVGDDHGYRMKRSYPPYRSRPIGLANSGGNANNADYNYGYGGNYREAGRSYDGSYGRHQPQQVEDVEDLGQQVDESDLTQQVEDSGFGRVQLGSQHQQQAEVGQQVDDSDLTQQVEDSGFSRVQLGSQNQQQAEVGQQVDDSDLTQQVEDSGFGRGQLGSHSQQQIELGQQVDDSDLTQQVEDLGVGQVQLGSHGQQQVDDSDLTQQVEDSGIGKLQLGSQGQQQIELGQQVDDSDLTQQVEDSGFGRVPSGSHKVDKSDLTQQEVDSEFGRVQLGSAGQQEIELGQQVDESDLTQQVEDSGFGKLHLGSQQNQQQIEQGQRKDNSDLIQEIEPGLGPYYVDGQQRDLTQQVEENTDGLGTQRQLQTSNSQLKLNQQQVQIANHLEEDLSTQLQEAIQTHQFESTYSSTGQLSRPSYQKSYEQLLNELQSNLTKQLRGISSGAGKYGSSYSYAFSGDFSDQEIANLRQKLQYDLENQLQKGLRKSYSYSTSWSSGSNTFNNEHNRQFGQYPVDSTSHTHGNNFETAYKDFNQRQVEIAQQLEKELSKQLKNAVKTTYYSVSYSGPRSTESEVLYQNLINELQRNLTTQLQTLGSRSRYSYSYTFNNQQLSQLRKQLENDLKLQLQQEVTSITGNLPENSLDSQPIGQELESSSLTRQNQNNPFRSDGKPGRQIINTDLTQQEDTGLTQQVEDNKVGDLHLGQQQIGQEQELTQQIEDQNPDLTQQIEDNSHGQLQFGNQQIEHVGQEQDLTQQVEDSRFGPSTSEDQSPIVQQSLQTDASHDVPKRVAQEQLDLQQVDKNYYGPPQIPSANLLLVNRPVTRRPIDNNNFLQRERGEQFNDDQYISGRPQVNYNQRPYTLPTLNQVIQQQPSATDTVEYNTELPSQVEPLNAPESDDLTQQQVDFGQQSIDSDLTSGQASTDLNQQSPKINYDVDANTLNSGHTSSQLNPSTSNQNLNRQAHLGVTEGQSVGVTSQGQIITQPQTLTDAENEANLLIQRLRASQRNRDQHSFGQGDTYVHHNQPLSYSQVVQHGGHTGYRHTGQHSGSYGSQNSPVQPAQEVDSFNQQGDSFGLYLNQQQAQFANRLENEFSKQLQDAVSQNYYFATYSSSGSVDPQLYQTSYRQLSEELQRNLTTQLQEILSAAQHGTSSVSVYGTLTNQQRVKLLNQLQADLSRQLQQSLKATYGLQQQTTGHHFGHSSTSVSNSYGSGRGHVYTPNPVDQVHYGQPGEAVQDIETVSEFQPLEPQRADVVHNVEPQAGYNVGVKGHGRRYHPRPYGAMQQSESSAVVDFQQPLGGALPAPTLDVQPQPAGDVVEVVPAVPGDPVPPIETVNQDDLPWWKRFGNKVKQGAHSLKEKIVG